LHIIFKELTKYDLKETAIIEPRKWEKKKENEDHFTNYKQFFFIMITPHPECINSCTTDRF
jgi:hypothetical protein